MSKSWLDTEISATQEILVRTGRITRDVKEAYVAYLANLMLIRSHCEYSDDILVQVDED